MEQKLYLECYAGISGDMMTGALLDLGADAGKLKHTLESLHIDGYTVEIGRAKKAGLDVCDFSVKTSDGQAALDCDMEYLHGHTHDEHGHTHDEHGHEHAHSHEHRGLNEITQIIEDSDMTEIAKQTALKIFDILAQAESEAHGVPAEEVHFHEVGAIDSIVDIAAAAICLDDLGIREVIVPVLWEGCGTIRCQHGVLPIPVPATLNIVRDYQLNLHQTETMGEFVTPTGAAIVAAICTGQTLPERYRVKRTGLGGGKREYERPSILRAMLIMPEEAGAAEGIWKLECNIDDCSGEAVGYAMERLFASGARDVHYTPVYMKKNRPGYLITVLCSEEDREKMEEILFAETTTIGVRRQWMERTVLPRKDLVMMTSYGEVRIKELERNGKKEYSPEYESVAQVARENGIPFLTAYKKITTEICGDL